MISEKIKYQRKTRYNISQRKLGKLLNVSRSTINNWEMSVSTPTIQNLIMLSYIFDVSIEYFLSDPNNMDEILLNRLTEKEKNIIVNLVECYTDKN